VVSNDVAIAQFKSAIFAGNCL
jgi:hypothetical protein